MGTQHTPGPFLVSEDDLTDALFYGATLTPYGSGTKAEARMQARAMLAAPALLAALTEIADTPCDHGPGFCPRAVAWAAVVKAAEAERRAANIVREVKP